MNRFKDEDDECRVFNPNYLRMPGPATVDNLTIYNTETGYTHTRYTVFSTREPRTDTRTLVVRVDGACKDNGKPNAEAAIGVYFGPKSPESYYAHVPLHFRQTSQVAELYAAIHALETIKRKFLDDFSVGTVLVVTDSKYVVEGLSQNIIKWRKDGYRDARNKQITNHEEIKWLDKVMLEMKDDGLEVAFWRVDRSENTEADKLAKGMLGL